MVDKARKDSSHKYCSLKVIPLFQCHAAQVLHYIAFPFVSVVEKKTSCIEVIIVWLT